MKNEGLGDHNLFLSSLSASDLANEGVEGLQSLWSQALVPDGQGWVKPISQQRNTGKRTRDPKTNSSALKMDGWKMKIFLGGRPIFRCHVSFREGIW